MNLATRVMSNGVEVIVADRSLHQGENLRIAPTTVRFATTLPSTITEEMISKLPPDGPQAILFSSLRSQNAKLVTVKQPTTYTYLKTVVSSGTTSTQTTEDVITNTITKLAIDPSAVPATEHVHSTVAADFDQAVYETKTVKTTYTNLKTLIDDEMPIVVSSKQTITNTIQKLVDPSELQPSEQMYDTNTYYNTYTFTKTLDDEKKQTAVQKNEVTQVIITEAPSLQFKPFKTMKSKPTVTTDIEKTYFVTYTYYKTFLKNGKTVIETNIATESDVVTEKFYLNQVRTSLPESIKVTAEIGISPTSTRPPMDQFKVYATKTYLTTFTYFTTLLQGKNTVTSSNTKVVYNVQTETISTGLDSLYLESLRSSFAAQASNEPIITTVMLAGEALEITAVQPTATKPPLLSTLTSQTPDLEHVITASTLNFIPDGLSKATISSVQLTSSVPTPVKKHTDTPEYLLNNLKASVSNSRPSYLTSTISVSTMLGDKDDKISSTANPPKKTKPKRPKVPTKNKIKEEEEEEDDDEEDEDYEQDLKVAADLSNAESQVVSEFGVNDFLSMGQTGINAINALKPVFSAVAGLISNNFAKKANNTGPERRPYLPNQQPPSYNSQSQGRIPQKAQASAASREPVYIPVGGHASNSHLLSEKHIPGTADNVRPDLPFDDNDKSESAWIDSLPLHGVSDERIPLMDRPSQSQIVLGKPTMESPIIQDGISIQPGQLITANSDVIVGRPSVLGKRPLRPAPPPPPQPPQQVQGPSNRRPVQRPEIILHQNDVQQHIVHQHKPQNQQPPPQSGPKQQINPDYIGMRPPPLPNHPQSHPQGHPQEEQQGHPQGNSQSHPQGNSQGHPQKTSQSHPQGHSQGHFQRNPQGQPQGNSQSHHQGNSQGHPQGHPQGNSQQGHPQGHQHGNPQGRPQGHPQSYPTSPAIQKYRYPQPIVKGTPVLPVEKTIILHHPSIDVASHTVRPSHPLLIDGGPSFFPGNNNEPITGPAYFPGNSNEPIISEPIPHPEPGFIGVSSIGVSNQDILQQHGLKEKEGHIIRGTIGERPVRPQQLGLDESSLAPRPTGPVILDNPDTMPVLQPGSKVNVPVSLFSGGIGQIGNGQFGQSYNGNSQFGQSFNGNGNSGNGHIVNGHGGHPQIMQDSQYISTYPVKKETKNPAFVAPPFEDTIWPGQVQNHILDSRPGQHIHHIPIEARPVIVQSDVQPGQVHNAPKEPRPRPNLVATRPNRPQPPRNDQSILNMRPPPKPEQRPYEPQINNGPPVQIIRGDNNNYQRPNVYGPIIVSNDQQLPPDDVIVSPNGNEDWESDDEPVRSEGERNGEVIQESMNSPSLPNNAVLDVVTEKPVRFEENRPEKGQRVTVTRVPNNRPDFPPRQQVYIKPGVVVDDFTRIPPKQVIRPQIDSLNNFPLLRSTPRPFNAKPSPSAEVPVPGESLTPPLVSDNLSNRPMPGKSQNPRFPVVGVILQDPKNTFDLPADVRPPPPPRRQPPSTSVRPPPRVNDNVYSGSGNSAVLPSPGTVTDERPVTRPSTRPRPSRPTRPTISRGPPITLRPPPSQEVLEPPKPPVVQIVESSISEPSEETIIISTTEGQDYSSYDDTEQDSVIITSSYPVRTYETLSNQNQKTGRIRTKVVTRKISPTQVTRPTVFSEFPPTKYVQDEVKRTSVAPSYPKNILGAGFVNRPPPLVTRIPNIHQTTVYRETTQRYVVKPESSFSSPTTRFITQTETLTITATETTVISSRGQPYTKTVVLTQTEAPRTVVSTIVGTITEIHTIDPSTVTTTISATVSTKHVEVTTTVYQPPYDPPSYPTFTIRPVGDPPLRPDDAEETELEIDQENEINKAVENSAPDVPFVDTEPAVCQPKCNVNRNEFCKEYDGALRCVCRPGFARTFFDRPCTPTYTYRMKLMIDKLRGKRLTYKPAFSDVSSNDYQNLAIDAKDGLRRAAMRSELRDIFQGATVTGFEPAAVNNTDDLDKEEAVMVNFYIQLSENIDEAQLDEKFKKSLEKTNFSLGGTELFAARETRLESSDFNECSSLQFNDCSENAECFNFHGTYTCSCKEGFSDLSPSTNYPGRECTSEVLGCDKCNYHGTCYTLGRGDDKNYCDCFPWYAGDSCNINLKVLLIALVTLGTVMLLVLVMCSVLTCLRKKQPQAVAAHAPGFMRYRGPNGQVRGTMDKAAMIQDTSSESSVDGTPLPYMTPVATGSKSRGGKVEASAVSDGSYVMEKDRSLTVMIPRAKYRPVQATSVLSTFAPAASPEQRLINYLDTGSQGKRKQSSSTERSRKSSAPPRKHSAGALVSAGFEVSAQVSRGAGGGGGGVKHMEHLTMVSQRSGRTTLRGAESDIVSEVVTSEKLAAVIADYRRTAAPTPPPMPPVTVSEARSYDETLVQPATRSLRRGHCSTFGSKPGSSRHDGQTMAERDIGSTFMMPQSHLYRPARREGSEGSNFDSL